MSKKVIITIILALSVFLSYSQTIEKQYITLDQCIQLSLKNNSGLKADELETIIFDKLISIQKSKRMPSINLSSDYMYTNQYRNLDDYEVADANLQVYLPIWQNGKNKSEIQQSKLGYESGLIDFKIKQTNLVFAVNEYFIDYLRIKKLAELAKNMANRLSITVDAANERLKLGFSKRSDLLKVQTEYSNALYISIQLETSKKESLQALLKIMGLPLDNNIIITDSLSDYEDVLEKTKPDSLYILANQYLPEFQLISKQIEQQNLSVVIEKKKIYPEIGAFGSFNYLKTPVYKGDFYTNAGLTLKMDLFTGGRKKNQIAIEKIKIDQLNYWLEETNRQIYSEINIAWLRLTEAREKINNAKIQIESSNESLQTINQQYLNGLSSMLELIDAQYADFRANQNYINALADYYLAAAMLKKKTGLLSFEYCK